MKYCWRYGVVIAVYLPLIAISTVRQSDCRELRPSEHGLTYQNPPSSAPGEKSPEMLSFFGGGTASNVSLPEARNMSDPSWWSSDGGRRGNGGGDHTSNVLLMASVACGIAGVVLLVVVAFLFMNRPQKQRSLSTPPPLPLPPPPPTDDK